MRSPILSFARLGWWLLMELGFSDLIDKFEEYFGRFWTSAILFLAGLAFSSFCMWVIWNYAVHPLLSLFPFVRGISAPVESVWIGLAFAGGAGVGTWLFARILTRRLAKRIQKLEEHLKEVRELAEWGAFQPPPHQF